MLLCFPCLSAHLEVGVSLRAPTAVDTDVIKMGLYSHSRKHTAAQQTHQTISKTNVATVTKTI